MGREILIDGMVYLQRSRKSQNGWNKGCLLKKKKKNPGLGGARGRGKMRQGV